MIDEYASNILDGHYSDFDICIGQFQSNVESIMLEGEGGVTDGYLIEGIFTREVLSVYVRSVDQKMARDTCRNIGDRLLDNMVGFDENIHVTGVRLENTTRFYSRTDNNEYIYNTRLETYYKRQNNN